MKQDVFFSHNNWENKAQACGMSVSNNIAPPSVREFLYFCGEFYKLPLSEVLFASFHFYLVRQLINVAL